MNAGIYKEQVFKIVGAAMSVHNELKWGLLEPIYNEALHLEMLERGIAHEREVHLPCYYKNKKMDKYYLMDIVAGDIIIELKSVVEISAAHRLQLFNYLRLTKKPMGLLINFGEDSLRCERYYFDETTNQCVILNANMEPLNNKSRLIK